MLVDEAGVAYKPWSKCLAQPRKPAFPTSKVEKRC